ncbi:unnamed protein product, partial [Mesorhabditis spiculigera]
MLKINQAEYCPWIETSGIQVFVHAAEEDIFSESGCIRSCYQEAVQESCGCGGSAVSDGSDGDSMNLRNDIDALGDPSTCAIMCCPQAPDPTGL